MFVIKNPIQMDDNWGYPIWHPHFRHPRFFPIDLLFGYPIRYTERNTLKPGLGSLQSTWLARWPWPWICPSQSAWMEGWMGPWHHLCAPQPCRLARRMGSWHYGVPPSWLWRLWLGPRYYRVSSPWLALGVKSERRGQKIKL